MNLVPNWISRLWRQERKEQKVPFSPAMVDNGIVWTQSSTHWTYNSKGNEVLKDSVTGFEYIEIYKRYKFGGTLQLEVIIVFDGQQACTNTVAPLWEVKLSAIEMLKKLGWNPE